MDQEKVEYPLKFLEYFANFEANDAIEIIDYYLEDITIQLVRLKDAVNDKNFSDMQFCAHKFKGGLLSLGIKKASETALNLELLAKENKIEGTGQILNKFEQELSLTKYYLAQYRMQVSE